MVNASTPATYVPLYVLQGEIQVQELVTDSSAIGAACDFLLPNSNKGLKLTGLPDTLLTVSNGIRGSIKYGTITFDSTCMNVNAGVINLHSANYPVFEIN